MPSIGDHNSNWPRGSEKTTLSVLETRTVTCSRGWLSFVIICPLTRTESADWENPDKTNNNAIMIRAGFMVLVL